MDQLRGERLQAKPGTGTRSPESTAEPHAGHGTPSLFNNSNFRKQGRAGHPCPVLHFWDSSPTSEVQVVQRFRKPNCTEWL